MANIKKPANRKVVDQDGILDKDWDTAIGRTFDAVSGPFPLRSFTVAQLPDPAKFPTHVAHVSDASGGAVPAYSDGTNWRRFKDDTVIS